MKLIFTILLCFIVSINAYSQKKTTKKTTPQINYTEQQAIDYIADYYSFYNADEIYTDAVARKISKNVFHVSVKYCNGGKDTCYKKNYDGFEVKDEMFWSSKVLILTIFKNGKYEVKEKSNY